MREIKDVLPTPSPPMYNILKGDIGEEEEDDVAPEKSLMVPLIIMKMKEMRDR